MDKVMNVEERFYCNVCKYKTNKKSSFIAHLDTPKHMKNCNNTNRLQFVIFDGKYVCMLCSRVYKHYQSLSRHYNNNCVDKVQGYKTIKEIHDDINGCLCEENCEETAYSEEENILDVGISYDFLHTMIDEMLREITNTPNRPKFYL